MRITIIGANGAGNIFAFGLYDTIKKAKERIENLEKKHPSVQFFWVKINK